MTTVEGLQRYRGHLFNWYDTIHLAPLPPAYISTVDSGNLAACALTLKQSCVSIIHRPLLGLPTIEGLQDVVRLMRNEVGHLPTAQLRTDAVTLQQLNKEVEKLDIMLNVLPRTLPEWLRFLTEIERRASQVEDGLRALAQEHGERDL